MTENSENSPPADATDPAPEALPAAPVASTAPSASPAPSTAPAPSARPFWSRTGTRVGTGIVGAVIVLMIGFGGGWVAHGELRSFGGHEQAWGPGGDRGGMHDRVDGQRAPRGGQGFGDGQRQGGTKDGNTNGNNTNSDNTNGSDNIPTPDSTPGS